MRKANGHELKRSSKLGSVFIYTVNKLYYSCSYSIARILSKNEKAKTVTRGLVVIPIVKIIQFFEKKIRQLLPIAWYKNSLIIILIIGIPLWLIFFFVLLIITIHSGIIQKYNYNDTK